MPPNTGFDNGRPFPVDEWASSLPDRPEFERRSLMSEIPWSGFNVGTVSFVILMTQQLAFCSRASLATFNHSYLPMSGEASPMDLKSMGCCMALDGHQHPVLQATAR
jgi:hypothetical protein